MVISLSFPLFVLFSLKTEGLRVEGVVLVVRLLIAECVLRN